MVGHAACPDYDSLPTRNGRRSAQGIWDMDGEIDHLGALNHLTAARKTAAAREVQYGMSFQLDWPYHKVGKPAFGRKGLEHKVFSYLPITGDLAHDDEISLNTQAGSQWDGFMHYADQAAGTFYNGVALTDDNLHDHRFHGIHYWCREGIVGRGVLLDWPRWLQAVGREAISPVGSYGISVHELDQVSQFQGVSLLPGDVLIIRTGYLAWYESASEDTRTQVAAQLAFTGIKQGEDTQRWLWNHRFAAVASDSVSWECYPPPRDGSMLHQWLLPHAGLPIGELWNLEELAEKCAELKKWTFLLTSAPLNVKGGIASPPNAVAIL